LDRPAIKAVSFPQGRPARQGGPACPGRSLLALVLPYAPPRPRFW